ncbi:MAG: YcaO-like family protein [Methanomassiliicoccales archaeon PtaU1.Bin124]|nr:MAG: YcaO-like family protein [Methanomassiliicoccales archaeon PtaU1.Bin124]
MRLVSRPKVGSDDGQRSIAAARTLERVEGLCKVAGITRVADITGLDRVGIPVFSSIRPEAEGGAISVYNGKGATPIQARVSAIMEGLERYSAEERGDRIVRKFAGEMQNAIDPREIILPQPTLFQLAQRPIAWMASYDIVNETELMVPACAVLHPYKAKADLPLFRSNTNGLASGNNLEEAVLHGLCEVIERDAWSLCEGRRKVVSDLTVSSGEAKTLADKFTSNGIELHFKDMTSDIGLPVIAVAADDVATKDPGLLTLGIGAHPDPMTAAVKALVEVAQSRLTQIHGAREDTVHADRNRHMGYDRIKKMNRLWFEPSGASRSLDEVGSMSTGDVLDDIKAICASLGRVGLDRVIVHDLTRKELDIPVARVIVPGLEVFAIDPDRVGRRLMEASRR